MLQKATATFDPQAKTLVISGELLPDTPLLHDMLIDLLHGVDQPAVSSLLVNRNNVLTYSVKFAESAGPSAQDLDITQLNKQLEEANSTIALLEDRLATNQKIAQMAIDEVKRFTAATDALGSGTATAIEPAPSND